MPTRRKFLNDLSVIGTLPINPNTLSGILNGETPLFPLLASRTKENSYWYIGHLMSLVLTSEQTGGKYALLRATERRGMEPPPHTHTKEDEAFLVLEGEVIYTVGGQTFNAKAGDVMFLPKNIQHSFKIQTEQLETLMLLTPGGFENYFVEMSTAAEEVKLPPMPQGPPDFEKIVAIASKYGILFGKP